MINTDFHRVMNRRDRRERIKDRFSWALGLLVVLSLAYLFLP